MSASLKHGTVRRYVDLPEDDVKWLERTYGDRNLSRMVTLILAAFRAQHHYSIEQLAELGASELKKQIISGNVDTELSDDNPNPPLPEVRKD